MYHCPGAASTGCFIMYSGIRKIYYRKTEGHVFTKPVQIKGTPKNLFPSMLMAKEETVLQGMIDKLIETGRYYGMEMNVEKTKVMRISIQPSPVTITIDQYQLENVKRFKYLGSM